MSDKVIEINGRKIGKGQPPYMIAEISCNHMGDIEQAKKLIVAGKEAGADAIKLQTYTADSITLNAPQDHFKIDHPLWKNMTLHELYAKAETPFDWMNPLFEYAKEIGITIFSAPFDITAADLLHDLDAPAYKIASFEAVHIPLIEKVAGFGKPLIISTGLSNLAQINDALNGARNSGCKDIILLHCISAYPTPLEEANLATIQDLARRYDVIVGLSDHTRDTLTSRIAVGLGAALVEKHIMLTADDDTYDKEFSLTPDEFKKLVDECKAMSKDELDDLLDNNVDARKTIGTPNYNLTKGEGGSTIFRPSILVNKDIDEGEELTEENLIIRRPGAGLAPKFWHEVIGKKSSKPLKRGDALKQSFIH